MKVVLQIAGFLLTVLGVGLWSLSAGVTLAGVLLLVAGVADARGEQRS